MAYWTAVDPALVADLVVVVHLGYVLFVILGLVAIWLGFFLRWGWVRRPAFRIPHLVCTVIVPIEALSGVICPLTTWERDLRVAAGQSPEDISFMGRLAREVLFYTAPDWVFTLAYVVFGLVVVATFFVIPIGRRAAPIVAPENRPV